jgi:outer membrane protein OmpA-like peptidoglycan-associated protein
MKPSFLLLLCLLMGSMATAQIELEHSYPGAANQASTGFSQLSLAPLEVSGCKYAWVDKKNHKVSLYDLEHRIFKTFTFPDSPFTERGYYEVLLITEKLFDNDPKVELLITGEDDSLKARTMILNEDEVVLLDEPGALLMGRQDDRSGRGALYKSPEGTKMILSYEDGSAKVFSLPGEIPSADCIEAELVDFQYVKGEKTIIQRIDTIYLDGLRVEKQRDTLVVSEEEYEELRKEAAQPVPIDELTEQQLRPGTRIALPGLRFERGNADLVKGSQKDLKKLLQLLEEHPELNIRLEGHTDRRFDSLSSIDNNLQLSIRRVKAIQSYLGKKGIAEQRVDTKGYGGTRPIASNAEETTRRLNRRVEVYVISVGMK